MNWHERMNQAVDHIERHLQEGVDLDAVARIACQSPTSFQRTFSIVTEMSVSEYIRRRRMHLAAQELAGGGGKVLDVSLKYGYDSPEAFTRAFKEIHGMPPSSMRKDGSVPGRFPRIFFHMTVKGDVVMAYEPENSSVRITNLYREPMPAMRFIGKRYTEADLNAEGQLMDKWNELFQNGGIDLLTHLPGVPGYEGVAHTVYHNGGAPSYWIGMMCRQDTPVPDGFDSADFPEGDLATCWVRGYRDTGELYRPDVRSRCLSRIQDAGYALMREAQGEPYRWTFERYHPRRFFLPDDEGRITMDYCVYLADRLTEQDDPVPGMSGLLGLDGVSQPDVDTARIREDAPQDGQPEPDWVIPGVAPCCPDAECSLSMCALTTLFLKLEGIEEATPFPCAYHERICTTCGECDYATRTPNLARHHLRLYHFLLTVTGVGLMWGDPNESGEYDLKQTEGVVPPWLEDRFDVAMKAMGYEAIRLDKRNGGQDTFHHIADAVRSNRPVLMKLDDGPRWHVVVGFGLKTGALFALDTARHGGDHPAPAGAHDRHGLCVLTDWFRHLRKTVLVTGRSERTLSVGALYDRMIRRLETADGTTLKEMVPRMLDGVTQGSARSVAEYLNRLAGYVMEARWHAAEAFRGYLMGRAEGEADRAVLRACADLYCRTHDVCWKVWGALGVGPHTQFQLPGGISRMLQEADRRNTLKVLFAEMFANDAAVLAALRDLRA